MIITNILGGLGNQLFQYATGCATAHASGQSLRFAVDSFASYKLHHGLQLEEAFALQLPRATQSDIRACLGWWRSPARVRRLLSRIPLLQGTGFLAEPSSAWWPRLRENAHGNVYLHGYWQSERYFEDYAPALRRQLHWRLPLEGRNADLAREITAAEVSVSLHVRRGDYVSNSNNQALFATCTPDYYIAALQRLQQLCAGQSLKVFAFSDDPAWVQQSLAPRIPNLVLVDHNRGSASWLDLRLMSLCRHHVIANSSFSWWGAWLDGRPGAEVIAPRRWYANGNAETDLVPSRWHRV